jgi:hypothetical protein
MALSELFVRDNKGFTAFALPQTPMPSDSFTKLAFGAGAVWLSAAGLAKEAPKDSWCAVHVRGGVLQCASAVEPVKQAAALSISGKCVLILDLDTAVTNAAAVFPKWATFAYEGGAFSLSSLDTFHVRVFDPELALAYNGSSPGLDRDRASLLVPLNTSSNRIAGPSHGSLLRISDQANIVSAFWALPVVAGVLEGPAETRPVGALRLTFDRLGLSWPGLSANYPVEALTIPTDGTAMAWSAPQAPAALTRFTLWTTRQGPRAELTLTQAGSLSIVHAVASDSESLSLRGSEIHLAVDRPVLADGRPIHVNLTGDLQIVQTGADRMVEVSGFGTAGGTRPALILPNALLSPAGATSVRLAGALQSNGIDNGRLDLTISIDRVVPILPDPYIANIDFPEVAPSGAARDLIATTAWTDPNSPILEFTLAASSGSAPAISFGQPFPGPGSPRLDTSEWDHLTERLSGKPLAAPTPQGVPARDQKDAEQIARMETSFRQALGSTNPNRVMMIDVSTNADQFGLGIGLAESGAEAPITAPPDLAIENGLLMGKAADVRAIALPTHQWEPLWTAENTEDPPFPRVVASLDDGVPTSIGVASSRMVPIAPRPVIERIVDAYNDPSSPEVVAVFGTLPFGLFMMARLDPADATDRPLISRVQPHQAEASGDERLNGGLQVTIRPHPGSSGARSPSLPGAAYQSIHGVGIPFGRTNALGSTRELFNDEFGPFGRNPGVPVERLDLSGYGATMFSRWEDPAQAVGVSQIHFTSLLGRTAYEVVQFRNIIYPYGLRIVRTITIERGSRGRVDRRDSGWVAVGTALFIDMPRHLVFASEEIKVHPGFFRGLDRSTHIRETNQVVTAGGAQFFTVKFDADMLVRNVVAGAAGPASRPGLPANVSRVPGRDLLGFALRYNDVEVDGVRRTSPLRPSQLKALLESQRPVGGGVDCKIELGAGGHRFRATACEVDVGADGPSGPEFAGVIRGGLSLPGEGSWSMVQQVRGGSVEAVDRHRGVPLVHAGYAGEIPSPEPDYDFRDAADLGQPPESCSLYGLLHAMDLQRALYPGVFVRTRESTALRGYGPICIADALALPTSQAVFPDAAVAIRVPDSSWALVPDPAIEAALTLELPESHGAFEMPAEQVLSETPFSQTVRVGTDSSGTRAQVTYRVRPAGSVAGPAWEFATGHYQVWLRNRGTGENVNGFEYGISGQAGQHTVLLDGKMLVAGVLQPIASAMSVLASAGLVRSLEAALSNPWELDIGLGFPVGLANARATRRRWIENEISVGPVTLKDLGLFAHLKIKPAPAGVSSEAVITIQMTIAVSATPYEFLFAVQVNFTHHALLGWLVNLKIGIGFGYGFRSPVVHGSVDLIAGPDITWAVGGASYTEARFFLHLSLELNFLRGLLSIELSLELSGGVVEVVEAPGGTRLLDDAPSNCAVGTAVFKFATTVALEVTLLFCISFELSYEFDGYALLSGGFRDDGVTTCDAPIGFRC